MITAICWLAAVAPGSQRGLREGTARFRGGPEELQTVFGPRFVDQQRRLLHECRVTKRNWLFFYQLAAKCCQAPAAAACGAIRSCTVMPRFSLQLKLIPSEDYHARNIKHHKSFHEMIKRGI